ncbi:MAG: DoxX family protein [Ktedonobacteraceae bacterium]
MLKKIACIALGMLFIAASLPHFFSDVELQIIPPFLPWRRAALYITGACELLGGIGVFIPRFRRAAGWGLAALLVAIFPANVYHALREVQAVGIEKLSLYHWVRGPIQILLIWWALWATNDKAS